MGCTMCEKADNNGDKYYYRWGPANVIVIGCDVHVKEIFNILTVYQRDKYNIKGE